MVLTQILSVNNVGTSDGVSAPFLNVATTAVTRDGFRVALERGEVAEGSVDVDERIGFIAIESPGRGRFSAIGGDMIRWTSRVTPPLVEGMAEGCRTIRHNTTFAKPPLVVASLMSRRAPDGGWLRLCSTDSIKLQLTVDEDNYRDAERSHPAESVGIVSFSEGFSARFSPGTESNWRLQSRRIRIGQQSWRRVEFEHPFSTPPVVTLLGEKTGDQPATLRISNVTRTSFDIAAVGADGSYANDFIKTATFVAATPGVHSLPDGQRVVVGTVDTAGYQRGRGVSGPASWYSLRFDDVAPFSDNEGPVSRLGAVVVEDRVDFSAARSEDDFKIVQYIWRFGDGSKTRVTKVPWTSHSYENPGSYTVALTVRDGAGLRDVAYEEVVIAATSPDGGSDQISEADAARFLHQATFGPTTASIEQLRNMGYSNWLDWQFSLPAKAHLGYVRNAPYSQRVRTARHEKFWADVVRSDSQLLERMAYALSQIFVISDLGMQLQKQQYTVTQYYDMLRRNAFGNYRDLIEDVTLHPVMGLYLSMAQNEKADPSRNIRPDENYAREIMQLFSIGMHRLRQNGTLVRDRSGRPIPTYGQNEIKELARVFTGWTYGGIERWPHGFYVANLMLPMINFSKYHDAGSKKLLNGYRIPAGLTAREDLKRALDHIFRHANVGPFLSRQLIQRFVTSNPTPQYVARVAARFRNNGDGVRGDLRAVMRAILLDPEARVRQDNNAVFGKLREPVIALANIWRAFDVTPGRASTHGEFRLPEIELDELDSPFGQVVLKSPSVFNFYDPFHVPHGLLGEQQLAAPEFQIATESKILKTTAFMSRFIQTQYAGGGPSVVEYAHLRLEDEMALADNIDALLNHLDILMLSGGMSQELRQILRRHLYGIPSTSNVASVRVRDAISLISASPDYRIQK